MPYLENPYEIEPEIDDFEREEFERDYTLLTTLKLTKCEPPRKHDVDVFCLPSEERDVLAFIDWWHKRIGAEADLAFAEAADSSTPEPVLDYDTADRVSLELLDKHPQYNAEYESGVA